MKAYSILRKTAAYVLSASLLFGLAGESAYTGRENLYEKSENVLLSGNEGSEAGVLGLDAQYHSQEEILEFYNEHPVSDNPVVFDEEPLVTAPGSLGRVSEESITDALNCVNMFRYIAGVNPVVVGEEEQEEAQAASLLFAANGTISHTPDYPAGFSEDIIEKGASGAFNSNVASSAQYITDTIYRYMTEVNGDADFGHRMQLLDYYYDKAGFGCAKSSRGIYFSATYIDAYLKVDKIISYPGQNQPMEFFGRNYCWTVTIPYKVDKSAVHITLTDTKTDEKWSFSQNGGEDEYVRISNFGNSSTLIFNPAVISYREGDRYLVEIEGIQKKIAYYVNFFRLTPSVPVENIYFTYDSLSVYERGDDPELEPSYASSEKQVMFTPSNASNKIVSCTVEDPEIAKVLKSNAGYIRVVGIKPGKTKLTVVSEDGGYTATLDLIVKPRAKQIEVDCEDEITIGKGQYQVVKAEVLPEECGDGICTWESTDSSVVKLNRNIGSYYFEDRRKIEGLELGSTTVCLTAKSDYSVRKHIKVNVVEPVYVTDLNPEKEVYEIMLGESVRPEISFFPENVTCKALTWSSSNRNVVTVDEDGVIKSGGIRNGLSHITVTADDGSGISKTFDVKVMIKHSTPAAPVASIVTKDSVSFKNGNTYDFSMDGVTWQSSNTFTGLLPDTEYTFYQRVRPVDDFHYASDASEPVTVRTAPLVSEIRLDKTEVKLMLTQYSNLTAEVLPDRADSSVTWSSSDESIATVTSYGRIIPHALGTAVITATSAENPDISASCTAHVVTECGYYGHLMTEYKYVDSTFTDAGHVHYWYCRRCGGYFLDKLGENETTEEAVIIPVKPMPLLRLKNYVGDEKLQVYGLENMEKTHGVKTFRLSCDKPCMVLVSRDNGLTYERLKQSSDSEIYHYYTIDVDMDMIFAVAYMGDITLDGEVNSIDALEILKFDVGKISITTMQYAFGDIVEDDDVNGIDAMEILKYDVKKIKFEW